MKRLLLTLCFVANAAHAALPWPTFESTRINAVQPYYAKEVTGTFTFVNNTERVIRVSQIAAACHCTYAQADKDAYKPGEVGTIRLVILQDEMEKSKGVTPISVTLLDNQDNYHVVLLGIQIDTTKQNLIEPSKNELVWKPRNENKTQLLEVRTSSANAKLDFKVTTPEGNPAPHIEVKTAQSAVQSQKTIVEVTPKSPQGQGLFLLNIEATDANKARQTVTIPLAFIPEQELIAPINAAPK